MKGEGEREGEAKWERGGGKVRGEGEGGEGGGRERGQERGEREVRVGRGSGGRGGRERGEWEGEERGACHIFSPPVETPFSVLKDHFRLLHRNERYLSLKPSGTEEGERMKQKPHEPHSHVTWEQRKVSLPSHGCGLGTRLRPGTEAMITLVYNVHSSSLFKVT